MSAARRLARALEASARAAGCELRLSEPSERPWSSATFTGARHAMVASGGPAEPLERWLAGLPGVSLSVPGHVVAELIVQPAGNGARLSALVLEA